MNESKSLISSLKYYILSYMRSITLCLRKFQIFDCSVHLCGMGMGGGDVESKPSHRDLKFKIVVLYFIVVICGYALWYFVLPFVGKYEKLGVRSYYWVANMHGEVRQLVAVLLNNGTRRLTVDEIWVDGSRVGSSDWGEWAGGHELDPKDGDYFYVVPRNVTLQNGLDYNLTVVTSSKNHYSFVLNMSENNTRTENVTISGCYFYHVPPGSWNPYVGVQVNDTGGTDVIIKIIRINGQAFTVNPRLWLDVNDGSSGIQKSFSWVEGHMYTVEIETIAGSTVSITAKAD